MTTQPTVADRAYDVITEVRDRYPRRPGDAPSEEIVEALIAAGLLATDELVETRRQRDVLSGLLRGMARRASKLRRNYVEASQDADRAVALLPRVEFR